MLTDCLEACQANESCGAVNYETGLCVLFSSNADKLPGMFMLCQSHGNYDKRTHLCAFLILTNVQVPTQQIKANSK